MTTAKKIASSYKHYGKDSLRALYTRLNNSGAQRSATNDGYVVGWTFEDGSAIHLSAALDYKSYTLTSANAHGDYESYTHRDLEV